MSLSHRGFLPPEGFIVCSQILNSVRGCKTCKSSLRGIIVEDADFTPAKGVKIVTATSFAVSLEKWTHGPP